MFLVWTTDVQRYVIHSLSIRTDDLRFFFWLGRPSYDRLIYMLLVKRDGASLRFPSAGQDVGREVIVFASVPTFSTLHSSLWASLAF